METHAKIKLYRENIRVSSMSTKEGFFVLNSENNIIARDKHKPKVGKSTEVSGSVERIRLANITNMQHQPKPSTLDEMLFIPASTKEYVNELKKENMTLMKLLADRNKIIELSGIELHKLRVNLQKMQQQNFQLAQSNSQMLAELNLGKDRLKLLQHELGCKKGLLVAKGLELEEKNETLPSQKVDKEVEMLNCEETLESSEAFSKINKPCNMNTRKQSKSLGPSIVKQLEDKKADNKRLCVRRQSARFKSEEQKPVEDLFEVDSTRLTSGPLHDDQMQEEVSTSVCLSVEKDDKECKSSLSNQAEDIERPSIGRPSRQAAKKVNTYKEVPLNVKMRRTE